MLVEKTSGQRQAKLTRGSSQAWQELALPQDQPLETLPYLKGRVKGPIRVQSLHPRLRLSLSEH